MSTIVASREPETIKATPEDLKAIQAWPLPLDEAVLEEFLIYVFDKYWDQIVFGPIIEGAAYELTCPKKPTTLRVFDGYLTVGFDGPHFHLCIGETKGNPRMPTPPEEAARRRPSKAQIFRRLDQRGAPLSWGFEMWNGLDQPMISIFFASPFIVGDKLPKQPVWERLAMWEDISARYLGREPDAFDQTGIGHRGGH